MRFLLTFLLPLCLTACVPGAKQSDSGSGKGVVVLKMDLSQLQACSISSPCPSGESCTSYDRSGNSYCYLANRESDVVACTSGELIVMESYPGQVGCN